VKNSGAIFLILAGLSGLYLYNTGRAQAIIDVLKNPAPTPATPLPGTSNPTVGGGGGDNGDDLLQCAVAFTPDCLDNYFNAVKSPFDALRDIGNIFTAPFGIRL